MKKTVLLICTCLLLPLGSHAGEPAADFIASKKVDIGHKFAYRCKEGGNVFEVEQRYNAAKKAEEVRFIVNDLAEEWMADGLGRETFRRLSSDACERANRPHIVAEGYGAR